MAGGSLPARDAAREHQEDRRGLPLRRPPHGHLPEHRRRPLDVLSPRKGHRRPRVAAPADDSTDREGAGHRRLLLSPQRRQALRLSGQRAQLHRQLPVSALQAERARLPARPGAGTGPGRAVHPARRPRTELQHQRDAQHRQLERRSVRLDGRRRGGALRAAPRRGQRSRPAHADEDRHHRQRPRLRRERQERRGTADGVRSPGVQVVRPPRQGHQGHREPGLRGDRPQSPARRRPRARTDRARGRFLHLAQALSQRRLLLGAHLPGDGLRPGDVPGAVRHRPHGRLDSAVGGAAGGR